MQAGICTKLESGDPSEITEAPAALVELLRKPERHRATLDGEREVYYLDSFKGLLIKNETIKNSDLKLIDLLCPIFIATDSSIGSRKAHVIERRAEVNIVLPYLEGEQLNAATLWLDKNKFNGLWE